MRRIYGASTASAYVSWREACLLARLNSLQSQRSTAADLYIVEALYGTSRERNSKDSLWNQLGITMEGYALTMLHRRPALGLTPVILLPAIPTSPSRLNHYQ